MITSAEFGYVVLSLCTEISVDQDTLRNIMLVCKDTVRIVDHRLISLDLYWKVGQDYSVPIGATKFHFIDSSDCLSRVKDPEIVTDIVWDINCVNMLITYQTVGPWMRSSHILFFEYTMSLEFAYQFTSLKHLTLRVNDTGTDQVRNLDFPAGKQPLDMFPALDTLIIEHGTLFTCVHLNVGRCLKRLTLQINPYKENDDVMISSTVFSDWLQRLTNLEALSIIADFNLNFCVVLPSTLTALTHLELRGVSRIVPLELGYLV
jgi:hypothetical protein